MKRLVIWGQSHASGCPLQKSNLFELPICGRDTKRQSVSDDLYNYVAVHSKCSVNELAVRRVIQ